MKIQKETHRQQVGIYNFASIWVAADTPLVWTSGVFTPVQGPIQDPAWGLGILLLSVP